MSLPQALLARLGFDVSSSADVLGRILNAACATHRPSEMNMQRRRACSEGHETETQSDPHLLEEDMLSHEVIT